MATVQDILNTPQSGYNYIDSLLAAGPDWNYLTADGTRFSTTLYYSFSTDGDQYEKGVHPFTTAQQTAARQILAYAADITGIRFVEAPAGVTPDIRFAAADLKNPAEDGVCYVPYQYTGASNGTLISYSASAVIYLDTKQPANFDPQPGTWGYQALLHEVGHALGLKHPFEATTGATTTLAAPYQDTTAESVMSYTQSGAYTSTFSPYDLAALDFLYGGDGLRGSWGVGTSGLALTGSPLDDTLTLPTGQVTLADTGGIDTVHYSNPEADYRITPTKDKQWVQVQDAQHCDLISTAVEYLDFGGSKVATNSLLNPTGRMIDGSGADDVIIGTAGSDMLSGFNGNDLLISGGGNDLLWGGTGFDTVRLAGQVQDAVFTRGNNADTWFVTTIFGDCSLVAVEQVQFDNAEIRLDLAGGVNGLIGLQQAGLVQYLG